MYKIQINLFSEDDLWQDFNCVNYDTYEQACLMVADARLEYGDSDLDLRIVEVER